MPLSASPNVLKWDGMANARRFVVAARDGATLGKVEAVVPTGFVATVTGNGPTSRMVEVKPTAAIKPGLLGPVKVRTDAGELEVAMYATATSAAP